MCGEVFQVFLLFSKKSIDKRFLVCYYSYAVRENIWRHSSVGQSIRFIPEVSPVRILVPLPNKGAIYIAPFIWPVGQAVKTPPFHGGNASSILARVTIIFFGIMSKRKVPIGTFLI